MPFVLDHGDGVSEVEAVSALPVLRPLRVNSAGEVSLGVIHPRKKSTPRLADLVKSTAFNDAICCSDDAVLRSA